MSEVIGFGLGHLAAAYVIGSAAALWLFRKWVEERIVTATLDTLIRDGYLYSWIDDHGITQLTKVRDVLMEKSELDIIDEMDPAEIEAIVDELIELDKARKEDNETDDTP